MRILIKIIAILVLIFLLAVGGLAAYLTLVFNPNDYRQVIVDRAKEAVGVELSINGDIGWSLYPWLALDINDVRLGFVGKPELAQFGQASAALSLPALLGGTIQIDSILVSDLTLDLQQDAEGGNNWSAETSATAEESSAQSDSSSGGQTDLSLAVDSVQLANANIEFSDAATGQAISITAFDLSAQQVALGSSFPISLSGNIQQRQGEEVALDARLDLTSSITLDLVNSRFVLQGLKLDAAAKPAGFSSEIPLSLSANVSVDQSAETVSIEQLSASLADLTAQGALNLAGFAAPAFDGNLRVPTFNPRSVAESLGVELPELREGALQQISLSTQLGGDPGTLSLSDLKLTLDETNFSGQLSYALETGRVAAKLAGDQINLDRYMPPSNEEASASEPGAGAASTEAGWSKEPLFDLSGLRAINAALGLTLNQLSYQGNQINNLALDLDAAGGLISVSQLAAQAFEGQLATTARIDARGDTAKFAVDPNLQGIALGKVLELAMEQPPVQAKVNLKGGITAAGNSMHSLVNSLNGALNLNAAEGVVQGIDVAQELCQNIENVTSLGINPDQVDRTTPIADLNSNFDIKQGVVTNPDLGVNIDAAKADARGTVDLPRQSFSYNLGLTLTDDLFNDSCGINPALKGIRIPVDCEGSLSADPAELCSLDPRFIEDIIKKAIGDEVKQRVEQKVQEEIGEKLEGEAGNLLRGLFGR